MEIKCQLDATEVLLQILVGILFPHKNKSLQLYCTVKKVENKELV